MRKTFTQFFVFVFMLTVFGTVGFAQIGPDDPEALKWPEHESTDQLQPATEVQGQTLTLTFPGTDPGNTVLRLEDGGIISLNAYPEEFGPAVVTPGPGGSGTFQQETLQIGTPEGDSRIVLDGNTVKITFAHEYVEDAKYYVTVSDDAIKLMDNSFYTGLGFRPFGYDQVVQKSASATSGSTGFEMADWAFQVDDVTDPVMVDCDYGLLEIENGDRGVDVTADTVRICFSEPVMWVDGNPINDLNNGEIAFYHATNDQLRLPAGEFGGDVLYQRPSALILSEDGMSLKIVLSDGSTSQDMLKSAPRGTDVWPADADIYMRFVGKFLEDKGGNLWAGVGESPAESYNPVVDKFWFTTRDADGISVDIINIDGVTLGAGHDPVWANEKFKITLGEDGLRWISNNDLLTKTNAKPLIELTLDGVAYDFTVESLVSGAGTTTIIIKPSPEYAVAKSGLSGTVNVVSGLVRDADLVEVEALAVPFPYTLGDFTSPAYTPSVNNILCTNFDVRVTGADREAIVYYAIINEDNMGSYWDQPTIEDIYRGYNQVWNTATSSWNTIYFNNVADGAYGNDNSIWSPDSFLINSSLTAFEHIDDFIGPNHGETFKVYTVALDPNADGPYTAANATSNPLDGRISAVVEQEVTLTDCLEPEHEWHFEGKITVSDPLYDACDDSENIKKQGRWNFKVPTGGYTDELQFVNSNLSWNDEAGLIASGVFTLSVSTDNSSFTPVEIESIVYANDEVIITPLNSYPSAGWARITLSSGAIMDASANPINVELSCTKQVESYCDPKIIAFSVETKGLMFDGAPEFDGLNGVVAKKDAKITVQFNKPLYTPKRDEDDKVNPILEPISEDPLAYNWIGNYVKVRQGDSDTATVNDILIDEGRFNYTVTKDGNGGITKVVLDPIDGDLEYESETWYYVEVEPLLQDEDRRELNWDDGTDVWNNNTFIDPHAQYSPYPASSNVWCSDLTGAPQGNSENYFMKFRTEDKIAPELMFTFEKWEGEPPVVPGPGWVWPYIADIDEDMVSCINAAGHLDNGAPIGAILTEWSQMGFDDTDYYIEQDPNGLRPYFTMRDAEGNALDFDIVVLKVWTPDAPHATYGDAVWFGFVPFTPLAEGETYSMEFNPTYVAPSPGTDLVEGDVFIDDNGNPLVQDTYVEFATCAEDEASCFEATAVISSGLVSFTPSVTITFDRIVDDLELFNWNFNEDGFATITDGTTTWEAHDAELFTFDDVNKTVTIPWESFISDGPGYTNPGASLDENTEYELTVTAGQFLDRQNETLGNCEDDVEFATPDTTAPVIDSLSPDIVYNPTGTGNSDGTYDPATAINPRQPGNVLIRFNEDVTVVPGKLVKVYHNGTSLRHTFVVGAADNSFDANTNTWTGVIPADLLYYDAHYHVDIEAGLVEDMAGNAYPGMTGPQDSDSTWTFATGSDEPIQIVSANPGALDLDPNLGASAWELLEDGTVQVNEVSLTLSEKAVIGDETANVSIFDLDGGGLNVVTVLSVTDFTSTDGIVWTAPVNFTTTLITPVFDYVIGEGAFAASDNENDVTIALNGTSWDFNFRDVTPPTATIWPTANDEHVAFNTHGYVRFSEPVVAIDGSDMLVVSQANLKSWIKVYDETDSEYLDYDEYVTEFINAERTHVRITFLDENAPAIGGSTANLIDEHTYTIEVNAEGEDLEGDGYTLEDAAGNDLDDDYSETFDVEDITAPEFEVAMCEVTTNSVDIKFTPVANVNPHVPTVRTYPAEGGTVYYIVLPESATAPTASQLFPGAGQLSGVMSLDITSSGDNATVALPETSVATGYNFVVYAVMQDDEEDWMVSTYTPPYNGAWIGEDPIFTAVDFPIGIEDIRTAPNKNMTVMSWEFCACDDDAPNVVEKTFHEDLNVPVNSFFTITFDELTAKHPDVNKWGDGTGGTVPNPLYAHEVRLRRWDNNVAIPVRLYGNGTGVGGQTGATGMQIIPWDWTAGPQGAPMDLDEETKYYIEIDREVVGDIPGSNCGDGDEGSDCKWDGCSTDPNYFAGWVGREDWWFQTTDNTPPSLVSVSPRGDCVAHETNEIVFTFEEGNEMIIHDNLGGISANLYVYETDNRAIPFEIIPVSSGVIANPSGDTWTITYELQHKFDSDVEYSVEWDYDVFTDNAFPTNWGYTDDTSYPVTGEGDVSGWDAITFTVEDFVLPTFNWAMVNTLWTDYDHDYVYPIANGAGFWNPNDADPQVESPVAINECGDDQVPHEVAFYVWTDEEVDYTPSIYVEEAAFKLEKLVPGSGWVPVSIDVAHSDYVGSETLLGGIDVENNYWIITPAVSGGLDGSTQYRFGIVGGMLEDVPARDCDANKVVSGKDLFTFCTWNTDPAVATLADGCDATILENETRSNYYDDCVCEKDYFDLCFDKVVVKTAVNGTQPPIGVPGGPWFSFANLMLTEADLMDTDGQYISFKDESGTPVVVDSVTITGNYHTSGVCYRLHLAEPLSEVTEYTFEVKPDVLKDITRVPNGNVYPGETWTFRTKWYNPPYVLADGLTPEDNEVDVRPDDALVINFNRDVTAGAGHIVVRDNGNPAGVVINVPGTDPTVSISGSVVTISHALLEDNTTYYAEIMADFVRGADCDAMPYAGDIEQGIIDDEWNWTTGDVDGPIASLYPNQNPNDYTAECVAPRTNLVLTFDENIEFMFESDSTELVIYKATALNPDGSPSNTLFGDVVKRIDFTLENNPQLVVSGTDAANGLTDNVITVIPTFDFESGATYYVRVEGNGIDVATEADVLTDALGNSWYYPANSPLPGVHYNDWWFKIADDSAPMLVSTTPVWDEVTKAVLPASQLGEGVTTDLAMEFDMDVLPGTGTIQIFEFIVNPEGGVANQQAQLVQELDVEEAVASGKIEVDGDEVTIKDVELLDGIDWYYILAEPGTFTSTVPCVLKHWEGIVNQDVWLFTTEADTTCPAVVSSSITSDAADPMYLEPASLKFEIEFTENINVVNSMDAKARILKDGTPVAWAAIEADGTSNMLSMVIDSFSAMLDDQTQYELLIVPGAIHDNATNSLTGAQGVFGLVPTGSENWMCDSIVLPFQTGDFTAPMVTDFSPVESCLENEVTLVVKFSEPVQDGDGFLRLTNDTTVVLLDAANDEDSADSTVTFTVMSPDELDWIVTIDEGFVTDSVYMGSADGPWNNVALDETAGWVLSIDDNTVPSLLSWIAIDDKDSDITNLDTKFDIVLTYDDTISMAYMAMAKLTVAGNEVNGIDSVSVDGTEVTVSVSGVADQTDYELVLADGFVMDDACNANASVIDTAGVFTVGDRTAPIIEDHAPVGFNSSYIGLEVMVDFFDDSALTVEDSIVITNKDFDGEVISVTKWLPELDDEQMATTLPALWFGTVEVVVPEGTVADVNGNMNDEYSWSFIIEDLEAPADTCLHIISPADGETCVESDIVLEMDFCERMAGPNDPNKLVRVFDMLEVQGQLQMNEMFFSTPVTPAMIDSTNAELVSIPVSGLKDHTSYIVMIDAGALTDEAGNDFAGINDPITWNFTTGDNTAPTVTLAPAGSTNDINEIVVMAQFSEEVMGADTAIMVEGAESFTVVMNATMDTATISIMAADMDTVMVTVPQSITDVNCNYNPLAEEVMGMYVVGDNTPPTVEVTDAPAEPMNTENSFTVQLTFSEMVMGVEEGLAGSVGLDSVMSDDHIVYTLYFSGDDETAGTLTLVADSVKDVSMNMNMLVEGFTWDYMVGDHVAPTVDVVPAMGDDIRDSVLVLDITFDEDVLVPDTGIVVTGGVGVLTGSGAVYQLEITAADLAEITVDLTAAITDDSDNTNALVPVSFDYTMGDRTAPTVSADPETLVDAPLTFDVIVTFSEAVTGVTDASVMIDGDEASMVLSTIVEGLAYKVAITGTDNDTITLSFTDAIEDMAGNALEETMFVYYTADQTAPVALTMTPQGEIESTNPDFVITFDEDVMVNMSGNLVITAEGETEAALEIAITEDMVDGNTITIPYADAGYAGLDSSATYVVTVEAGIISDLSGNEWNGINDDSWTFMTGDFPTGISEIGEKLDFKVYPNPFKNYIRVDNYDKLNRVVITNIAGQRVLDIENPEYEIRTGNLVTGVYVVTLIANDEIVKSERIIKR